MVQFNLKKPAPLVKPSIVSIESIAEALRNDESLIKSMTQVDERNRMLRSLGQRKKGKKVPELDRIKDIYKIQKCESILRFSRT